ncbi:MAG: energy-coupling factor transporter transmembrane protein EcfT [Armatimonadota bacterium]|nr:energy-coupling factor transporter transmembrane protein EcfT [Armatimonadota bacterium]
MPHHIDLYVRKESLIHKLDHRAKMVALSGFILAVFIVPTRPLWPAGLLCLLLGCVIVLERIPPRVFCLRMFPILVVVGLPFGLSQLGGEQTRTAGELFALKSLLVATALIAFTASTRIIAFLEVVGRVPILSVFGQLGEFILRGTDLLIEEVIRTNRAWTLRASFAPAWMKLTSLLWSSVSLLVRAVVRSERVGAAMVLRGFQGKLPTTASPRLEFSHLVLGLTYALVSIIIAGVGRWL